MYYKSAVVSKKTATKDRCFYVFIYVIFLRFNVLFYLLRLLFKQEIRSVEYGICPIAEFTSP